MRKSKFKKTSFLLPMNNFLVGLGSVLNVAGKYFDYNYSNSTEEADRKAIESDWQNVGQDIRFAQEKFKKKHKKDLCLDI